MTFILRWLSRSTAFAVFFAVTAYLLALKGLLTNQYVAVITALHVTVVSRAIADDYHERAMSNNAAPPPDEPANAIGFTHSPEDTDANG